MESPATASRERELLRRWAETWRRAGVELEAIRRRDLRSLDTQEAIRQIFGEETEAVQPSSVTSGLVERQTWFARLRAVKER